jgi:magnesium-transporting ATPase (P-type)
MTTSLTRTPDQPHMLPTEQILDALATDIDNGLTSEEAALRLERYGRNELEAGEGPGIWSRVVAQFSDPLVIMLIVAMLISLLAWFFEGSGETPYEPIVIAIILIANAALGLWQELKADNAVAELQKMTATHATVWRDGERRSIPSSELVPGDILLLSEGDAVSADARVATSESLRVAEASLTGESQPVSKQVEPLDDVVLADRSNMVFNGTVVTAGRGIAIVIDTGMTTEMGSIASMLDESEQDPTPLQIELARVGKVLGIVVLVLSAIVVGSVLLVTGIETVTDVIEVLLVGVSLAVAAIPEGLVAIVSIVLAIGVQRMAARDALVKKLSSVETLGSASVICSDKTGTLTRNEMTIEKVVTASGEVEITGSGYAPVGEAIVEDEPLLSGPLLHEVHLVLRGGSLANDASTRETDDGRWEIQGDPTEAAFLVAEQKLGIQEERIRRYRRIAEIPFSSERKMMTTVDEDDEDAGLVIVTKGAPDVLLDRCTHEYQSGDEVELTADRRRQILASVNDLANQALRTLAVAYRRTDEIDSVEQEQLETDLILVGIVGIIDPPREEVRDAIDEAQTAGIRVVMITGDHPLTATRIAEDLRIAGPESRTVTGAEVRSMSPDEFDRAASEASVFARVAPEDKLRIIDSLKRQRQIVAMTGDGVNDAPALRRADIGVAMGITGTEVSKEAADMILTDDDFATIVAAVREGRAIFENIRKFLRYLLGSNFGEVLVVFLGVIGAGMIGLEAGIDGLAVPLLATQILWINLLTDSGLALALGIDPTIDDLMADPPRKLDDRMIDAKMGRVVGLTGLSVALSALVAFDLELTGGLLGGSGDLTSARTHAFTTVVLAQVFNAFNSRSYSTSVFGQVHNRWLTGAAALTVALQVLVVHAPFLNEAFDTAPMSLTEWGVTIGLASVVLWIEEIRKLFVRRRSSAA